VTRLGRYALFQVPGIVAVAVACWALWAWAGISAGLAAALLLAWIAKDVALYPLVKASYEAPSEIDPSGLIGREGVVSRALDPRGYVKLGGETWRARLTSGAGPVAIGQRVRVASVDGLTLVVVPAGASFDR